MYKLQIVQSKSNILLLLFLLSNSAKIKLTADFLKIAKSNSSTYTMSNPRPCRCLPSWRWRSF